MRTKPTGLKLRNLGNDAFSVETPPEHIKLHGIVLAVAKKQSGKSFLKYWFRLWTSDRSVSKYGIFLDEWHH